jgi:thymidine kinase
VVGIDEAQFFDDQIVSVCESLASRGVRVIVAGLDMDYLGKPFGQMPQLLAVADFITKLHAICVKCGNLASISFRKAADDGQILLGATDTYEPRCRKCYHEP